MNTENQKLPYNTWYDHRKGFVLPKSPFIKNTPEVVEWLRNNVAKLFSGMPGEERSNIYHTNDIWLYVGIGCSNAGYIYCYCGSENPESFAKYSENNPTTKIFDNDFESFKRYMLWVAKLGPKFTKQLKNK